MKNVKLIDVKNWVNKQLKLNNKDMLDCNFLIANCLGIQPSNLFMVTEISAKQFNTIKRATKKRVKGKPISKIFKTAYFYGNKFFINNNVLSCRQDSEILIETIEKYVTKDGLVLDMCTGSGCLGITLFKLGFNNVVCSDISSKALKVAKKNAKQLNANVGFVKSNLFEKIKGKFNLIVCNPPYISEEEFNKLDIEVKKFDPKISLVAKDNGLYFYKKIINQLDEHLLEDGFIVFEIGYNQAKDVCLLLKNKNYNPTVIKDYGGNDRVIIAKKEI